MLVRKGNHRMELLLDIVLAPIVGFILAQIIKRLPAKIQLFFGSLIIALIVTLVVWVLFISIFKPDFAETLGQTLLSIQILFVVILVLTFFGINYVQTRRKNTLTQDQFALASSLIRGYQFQKALDILAKVKHPQAREWETILHDMIRNDPDFLQQLESNSISG